ncbi:MAG: HNH endonuclease [Ignavibacteriaceae bacterium]|jgi:hypothetical protein
MAFSEKIKYDVKKRAHLSCCVCKSIGIEVHHIVPQSEGGSDDFDNASPLCPSCHETYGANPQKRKFIMESRDIWYDICETRFRYDSDRIDQLQKDINILSEKLDAKLLSENIAGQLFKMIKESPFFVEKNKDDISWSIGEVVKFLLDYKDPLEEMQIKNLEVSYALLFQTKGDNDASNREYNSVRNQFLNKYGSVIAKKLTINIIKRFKINWNEGVTEEDMSKIMSVNFVTMIILLHHEDLKPKKMSLKVSFNKNEDLFARLSE